MNVAGRLAAFALVVALVFAGAAFAGSRLDVHPGKTTTKPSMGEMAAMAPQPVRGLAVSENGLTLAARAPDRAAGPSRSRWPSGSSTAADRPCATSTSSTPSACTSSSCAAT